MRLGNDANGFGAVSRALHWIMAAGILATLPLGLYVARMEPSLSNIWLYGLHKTIGLSLLVLLVLRVHWHMVSRPPGPLAGGPDWADALARATHRTLYALMVIVPVAGWVASSASGIDTVIFGRLTVPAIAPVSPGLEDAAFAVHRWSARLLGLLVLLHVVGAIRRALSGDGTLRRMVIGRAE